MDAMVTARVPVEIKEQGNKVLKSIGATPTQLVNAAYEYVLVHKKLPETSSSAILPERGFSSLEKIEFLKSVERTSFAVPESFWGNASYKEMIAHGRRGEYEDLA